MSSSLNSQSSSSSSSNTFSLFYNGFRNRIGLGNGGNGNGNNPPPSLLSQARNRNQFRRNNGYYARRPSYVIPTGPGAHALPGHPDIIPITATVERVPVVVPSPRRRLVECFVRCSRRAREFLRERGQQQRIVEAQAVLVDTVDDLASVQVPLDSGTSMAMVDIPVATPIVTAVQIDPVPAEPVVETEEEDTAAVVVVPDPRPIPPGVVVRPIRRSRRLRGLEPL